MILLRDMEDKEYMVVQYTQVAPVMYGNGAVMAVGEKVKAFGCSKVLIAHGKSVKTNGTLEKVQKSLEAAGITYVEYEDIKSDAPDYCVNAGAEYARNEKVDGVIAVGGGSVLDAAKAINILITNEGTVDQWYANPGYQKPVPLICIPTTSGTGSESTGVGVIYDTKNNYKNAVLRGCELAILDPELTVSAPAKITAGCALDAFAHALEATTSAWANPRSDVLACDAIKKITNYLPVAYKNGEDLNARGQLLLASNFAGIAFGDANVHVGHAISHAFGTAFHMAHGEGCALTLPVVLKLAAQAAPEKLLAVCEAMGLQTSDVEEAKNYTVEKILSIMKACGIQSLKERGITLEQALGCVDYAFNEWFVAACSPRAISKEDMVDFITDIYNN